MIKKLLLLITVVILSSISIESKAQCFPFEGKTRHKTIKKMSKRQVRDAQHGKTMYYRNKRGEVVKRKN